MRSKLIRKIIASTLIFSMTLAVGAAVFSEPTVTVQADDDWDDRYDDDDWDDRYDDDDWDDRYDDDWDDRYDDDDWDDDDRWYRPSVGGNTTAQGGTNSRPSTVTRPTANTQAISSYLKNVYKNIFGREVDQQGLNFWVQKLSSGQVELEDFFKNLLVEKEFSTVAPTPEDKIKKLYAGIFQREPDQGGFNYWLGRYKAELRDEGNEREALREVIDDMTDGAEFKQILNKLGLDD